MEWLLPSVDELLIFLPVSPKTLSWHIFQAISNVKTVIAAWSLLCSVHSSGLVLLPAFSGVDTRVCSRSALFRSGVAAFLCLCLDSFTHKPGKGLGGRTEVPTQL